VPFDIETTGFDADDVVTVVGFAVPLGVRVFVNTDGRAAPDIDEVGGDVLVKTSTHTSEHGLLAAVAEFVQGRFRDADVLLVAYNGERWGGGFDLPFLRTRFARLDLPWPFTDVPYADVLPLVTKRFNTTVDGDEHSDLDTAYDALCDGSHGELDPFAESAEAVTAFENGGFEALVAHNVADVLRTRDLGRLAERYCAKSDFDVKSLTPTRTDT
jgi:DNA polymerase III epsilon subunit-like protein